MKSLREFIEQGEYFDNDVLPIINKGINKIAKKYKASIKQSRNTLPSSAKYFVTIPNPSGGMKITFDFVVSGGMFSDVPGTKDSIRAIFKRDRFFDPYEFSQKYTMKPSKDAQMVLDFFEDSLSDSIDRALNEEEVPTNNIGSGEIDTYDPIMDMPIARRKLPVTSSDEVGTSGDELDEDITESEETPITADMKFVLDSDTFEKIKKGKKKWTRWSQYIDPGHPVYNQIRTFSKKWPKKPICCKNADTDEEVFLKYNRRGGGGGNRKKSRTMKNFNEFVKEAKNAFGVEMDDVAYFKEVTKDILKLFPRAVGKIAKITEKPFVSSDSLVVKFPELTYNNKSIYFNSEVEFIGFDSGGRKGDTTKGQVAVVQFSNNVDERDQYYLSSTISWSGNPRKDADSLIGLVLNELIRLEGKYR